MEQLRRCRWGLRALFKVTSAVVMREGRGLVSVGRFMLPLWGTKVDLAGSSFTLEKFTDVLVIPTRNNIRSSVGHVDAFLVDVCVYCSREVFLRPKHLNWCSVSHRMMDR